ncbi:MAG: hypothetical protein RLZZ210_1759 [Pseudomonadota bacterium]|jgi:Xaa-Pro aminopeptidase
MHNFINLKPQYNDIYQQRWQNLADNLPDNSLVLVGSGDNIYRNSDVDYPFRASSNFNYLTGFTEPNSVLCLIKKQELVYSILFALPKNEAQEIWHGLRCGYEQAGKHLGVDKAYSIDDINSIMPRLFAQVNNIAIEFNAFYTSNNLWRDVVFEWLEPLKSMQRAGHKPPQNIINLHEYISELRLFKDEYEQEIMLQAGKIASLGHIKAMQCSKSGIQEDYLEAELIHTFKQNKAQSVAYNSIVATGANTCILHHRAGQSILKDGDLCLIDAGCELDGYASDITRTFPVNGKFTKEQAEIYNWVVKAQQAAIDIAQVRVTFEQVHQTALNILVEGMLESGLLKKQKYGNVENAISSNAYQQFYMHRTSHWLGLDVHDVGRYKQEKDNLNNSLEFIFNPQEDLTTSLNKLASKKTSIKLEQGMALTIEPAIYIRPHPDVDPKYWNIGIRIEDDIIIQAQGNTVLTRDVPVDIQEIERIMSK